MIARRNALERLELPLNSTTNRSTLWEVEWCAGQEYLNRVFQVLPMGQTLIWTGFIELAMINQLVS